MRAGLVAEARDWPWSSVHVHLSGVDDGVTTPGPLAGRFPNLAGLLDGGADDNDAHDRMRRAESIGRPLGSAAFLEKIEAMLGRPVAPRKRGPKPKQRDGEEK